MPWVRGSSLVLAVAACGPVVGTSDGGNQNGSADDTGGTSAATLTSTTTAVPSTSTSMGWDTGAIKLDARADSGDPCAAWASSGCAALPSPNADVMGSPPPGIPTPSYAVFSSDTGCGFCVLPNIAQIYLVADPAELAAANGGVPINEGFVLHLASDFGGFGGPVDQDVAGSITAYSNGEQFQAPATFFIENFPTESDLAEPFMPEAPSIVRGRFAVDHPDWSLAGSFNAAYCPQLNLVAICE